MYEVCTTPVIKRIKQIQLPLLLLVLGFSFPAQAAVCDHGSAPRLTDTIERPSRADPDFSPCWEIVNLAYIKWENIACNMELEKITGDVELRVDRETTLENWGLHSPPDQDDAQEVIYTKVLDMTLAGESSEKTQQMALKTCRELELREKGGEWISW